ncbi:PCYCGC motif-containing (lipo)protein [Sporosarcina obsidiansis]|uniref:PCYCGC motif-containing (lipo)protein n=1 Tax=Sporosarcina obsidiansis TaxID=2660748 RepID=UPI00129B62F3|nr:PCYCGC motif-containing (lipo)protein [Sporosarcina obsidiansis]
MKKKLLAGLAALTLALAACGNGATEKPVDSDHQDAEAEAGHVEHLANGDLQEVTASANVLPSFLDGKPEDMRLVYQVAGKATDILQYMPCYCGCGESAGHESNMNCFIDEVREDGSIVWDDHGTRCQVCLEIAVKSVQMKQDGKSLKEIRDAIDTEYGNGNYAKPTDTPMPA